VPLWNKIYNRIIEITKLFEKIDHMEVRAVSKKMEADMYNRKIVNNRVPMVVSMSVYVFLIITVLALVALNIVPLSAGIIGCILGVSFFLTALNDYKHRGQKLC
jgi:CBS domain containing-hemolysin-like protein